MVGEKQKESKLVSLATGPLSSLFSFFVVGVLFVFEGRKVAPRCAKTTEERTGKDFEE